MWSNYAINNVSLYIISSNWPISQVHDCSVLLVNRRGLAANRSKNSVFQTKFKNSLELSEASVVQGRRRE